MGEAISMYSVDELATATSSPAWMVNADGPGKSVVTVYDDEHGRWVELPDGVKRVALVRTINPKGGYVLVDAESGRKLATIKKPVP